MQLRPYQIEAVNNVRAAYASGVRRPLLVMPCGAGKTQVFSYIAKGVASNRKRVLILAHRRELLQQISRSLNNWGVSHGILDAQRIGIPRQQVVVGSVFTVYKRLRHMPPFDLIIQDEAHHCSGTNTFSKVLNHYPTTRQLGVTATPARTSQEPLGDSFDKIIMGPDVATLTSMGYLTPMQVYAPGGPNLQGIRKRAGDYVASQLDDVMTTKEIMGNSVEQYRQKGHGKLAVAFCCSIKHSEIVCEEFKRAGYRSTHVDGKMDNFRRDEILKGFARGQIDVLTSCSLITEGWDCPQTEVGIMLRPTESLPLWIQMAGRLVRTYPGKSRAILLDHAGNTLRHSFIDTPRQWTLEGDRAVAGDKVPRVITCENCFACFASPPCPRCGHKNETKHRLVKQIDGELVELSNGSEYDAPEESGDTLKDLQKQFYMLRSIGRRQGRDNPEQWAWNIVCARVASKKAGVPMDELAAMTIDRERVVRAMSNEDPVDEARHS